MRIYKIFPPLCILSNDPQMRISQMMPPLRIHNSHPPESCRGPARYTTVSKMSTLFSCNPVILLQGLSVALLLVVFLLRGFAWEGFRTDRKTNPDFPKAFRVWLETCRYSIAQRPEGAGE